ncbi:hypothetical protein TQ38_009150 [Novosphingobium sp. P6W]|nr:hypothetical protein TQ38_009150 [Novosphingobium sp. P6W]
MIRRTPITLISALAEEGTHGFELLRKPYSVAELSITFTQIMRGKATTATYCDDAGYRSAWCLIRSCTVRNLSSSVGLAN